MTPLKLFKRQGKRTCVVGLDGVPYSLLTKLAEDGVMPAMRELITAGKIAPMRVTLPEISSVSWTSFMTGVNPGEHGIFGFTDLSEDNRSIRFPSFRDVKTKTIWDRLGEKGYKSVVINQPSTYPARPIPGVLIAGFVAIELERSVSPPQHLTALKKMGYEIDVDTDACKESPEKLFASLDSLLEGRRKVLDFLWSEVEWNLMEVVITGTDRLHHYMWDAVESTDHPRHASFLNYYRRIDTFIGEVFERFRREHASDNFFILSDHGFCGTKKEVFVNTALESEKFLHRTSPDVQTLEGIASQTKAFALDPARIYIRKRGRFPDGCVKESDVLPIKRDIKALFESLEHNGGSVVRRIFDADEVYSGPWTDKGPDLLIVPVNGYDLKGRIGNHDIYGERRLQGMHTWDNAFFFSLRRDLLEEEGEIHLLDVPRKILRSLDAV